MSRFRTALAPLSMAALAALCPAAHAAADQTVVITGNPLGRDGGPAPVSVLSGDGLAQRRAGTLGETLDGLPGVSGSGFGPNASRPVIRGLDGDRVRLLDNGGASIDASNLSFDHASATDPLVAERIEVLRGPAALLYGGNATGGVVNVIDNRIPRLPAAGLSGRAEVRLGGAAAERSGAAVLEGGGGPWAWHADAYGRRADDLRTPRYTPVADGDVLDPATRVRNSAAQSQGGALGAGWVGRQGYLGVSAETMRNDYGVTAEPDVTIRMKRDRLALGGEWRGLVGPITSGSFQASHTRYQHQEVEGSGDVGTTFRSSGDDLRLQLHHAPLGPLQGVFGVQAERMDFQALGEEAFVPGTQTRSSAVFLLEEMNAGPVVLSGGARAERVTVASDGDADPASGRFGAPQQRRYTPGSVSLGLRTAAPQGWQASASVGRTERAPAYYELYANGVHVATGQYERGDTTLPAERSRHVELGLGWVGERRSFKASVFDTRFARYVSLDATGREVLIAGADGQPDASVPEYAFRAVRARLRGAELEGKARLPGATWAGVPLTFEMSGSLDAVRGDNLDTGEPLPRLPPLRARLALEAAADGWRVGAGLRHQARQDRVPATDTPTPSATLLDLWASGDLPVAPGLVQQAGWFAKLGNVTNQLAYNAAAVATIRGLSPQAGRSLSVGVRARF